MSLEEYKRLDQIVVADPRMKMSGEDCLKAFGFYISKLLGGGGRPYRDSNVIKTSLYPPLNLTEVARQPLFEKLLSLYECAVGEAGTTVGET